ncbi:TetR/AcrR family transcriptional regulator [Noviherbaspirillum denitrificans]|uniref:TetR family transcriptional regulator n=1 Tax=Noviherbaspirillum denitrificans TaxID=1968433 RepID=A0A254TGN3_9BURK|nr:TetR/AcrR family transcriptional regulator [Noviherbaspirillum denitrificans]OWW21327.1 TetR family transcriptional regulator [Noviherbaspirillum denitrificans]
MARIAGKTTTPNQLLDAGRELFLTHGYNATGIQQITDLAGVPKGSFYNHFASKEVFAATIIDQYAEGLRNNWIDMMSAAPPGPLDAIRYAFAQLIAKHESDTCWKGCLVGNFAAEMSEASDLCRERLATAMKGWRSSLAKLIRAAQEAGEVRQDMDAAALAALIWDMWEGAILRMKVEQSTAPLRESTNLVLNHLLRPA